MTYDRRRVVVAEVKRRYSEPRNKRREERNPKADRAKGMAGGRSWGLPAKAVKEGKGSYFENTWAHHMLNPAACHGR
jgi:hypothetical protein